MAADGRKPDLLVIVGPTASGKSELAMRLAKQFNGEIVSADSRMLYKGMDIGTGKPSQQDQQEVPHHLVDVVDLDESFSAAKYKQLALNAIAAIRQRGRLPILVGGSGLYVDAVIYDFGFLPSAGTEERQRLNQMSLEQLQRELAGKGLALPTNSQNKRHLIRALEVNGKKPSKAKLYPNSLVVGLSPAREKLAGYITMRNEAMINRGLKREVQQLKNSHNKQIALDTIGYKEWEAYFNGSMSLVEVRELITKNSLQYAKRQLTWFRRNKSIIWFEDVESAEDYVQAILNN